MEFYHSPTMHYGKTSEHYQRQREHWKRMETDPVYRQAFYTQQKQFAQLRDLTDGNGMYSSSFTFPTK